MSSTEDMGKEDIGEKSIRVVYRTYDNKNSECSENKVAGTYLEKDKEMIVKKVLDIHLLNNRGRVRPRVRWKQVEDLKTVDKYREKLKNVVNQVLPLYIERTTRKNIMVVQR